MKIKSILRHAALASVLGAATTVPAGTIANDLVVHLPFDGDYINNAAGSAVTATAVGAPTIEAGRIGSGAVHISNAKDGSFFNYVTLGVPAELNFGGTTDYTISAWIKVNSKSGDPSFLSNKDWRSGGNAGYVLFVGGGGNFGWNYKPSGGARVDSGGSGINDAAWHHVAVSYDRDGNALTFLDGVLANTTPIAPATETIDSGLATNIGQDGTGSYTDGGGVEIDALMDDVAIWRRAVTAFEIQRVYQFGTNGVKVSDIPDPAGATVASTIPVNGATDLRTDTIISADIIDGATPLNDATVQLSLNGAAVVPGITKVGSLSTIAYQSPTPLENGSTNTAQIIFNNGSVLVTNKWTFVVIKPTQPSGITAQWDFDNANLAATIGQALEYRDGAAGTTAAGTRFGTTASFGIPAVGGGNEKVIATPAATTQAIGYLMRHGARPNGDPSATKVNQWTMIMDILIPTEGWHSFIQIDSPANSNDGDLFVNPGSGIGISGSYQGTIVRGQWHRVTFAVDMTTATISKFIDGVKVSDQTAGGLNGRWGLLPTAILFGDEDGESQASYLNSVQIRNYKMSDAGVAALGGPSAGGIPTVSGQWDFEAQNLAATIGTDLATRPDTEFVTLFETADIGGTSANVMHFNYGSASSLTPLGYILPHGVLANGGGEKANQYTIIMDIMFPASSSAWRSLLQIQTNNTDDGDIFLNPGNGLGISGQYQGSVTPDAFHRVAFTVDLTKRELGKYIDGVNVVTSPVGASPGTGLFQYLSTSSGNVDQRWALDPIALLLADEDGELAGGFINSLQTRPVVLTPTEIASLGKATAGGIPVVIPSRPTLTIKLNEFGLTTVSWPIEVTGYILESSPALGATAVWTTVDNVFNNSFEESRVPAPGLFYRLRRE